VTEPERERFDRLLERVLDALPPRVRALLDEAPLIVDDRPDPRLLAELGMEESDDILCGLHSGTPLTERSVEGYDEPEKIHLFREGIIDHAGGRWAGGARIEAEIRITLLHEIGHHFGLEEEDLERLGYD
jgi:predicted Zn-dependent protease with MMP-like domain